MARRRFPHTFVWLLLAAALFMRAFLPQGYMPERTEGGALTVRVCGSGHLLQIPTGKDEVPPRFERAEPPCAFAGLGTPALPPFAGFDLPVPGSVAESFAVAAAPPLPATAAWLRPPARGPPHAA